MEAWVRNPHEVGPQADAVDEFLRLACLVYGGDDRARPARAAELLRADPSLAAQSLHAAAAAGDPAAAREQLAAGADPDAQGGPFSWEPLLYLAYSRVPGDQVAVARLLLEAGASPHAGYLWGGTYPFTALTGAFGSGEDSPNQPPHPQSAALARLLLEAGADPNDDQTIYNRHFRTEDDHLELLFAFGLGGPRRGPWPERLEGGMDPGELVAQDALVFVAGDDAYAARVALLLGKGVDPDGRGTRHPAFHGRRPLELAVAGGARRNAETLLAAGAAPIPPDDPVLLVGRALAGEALGPEESAKLREAFPRALEAAAERGDRAGVERLAALGYDVNSLERTTALHLAAFAGDEAMCELLLDLGADPRIRDREFDGPASGWARHAGHEALADRLAAAERTRRRRP